MSRFVAARAVILPLKGQELVDRRDGGRIGCGEAHQPATCKRVSVIADLGAPGRHHAGSRDLPGMDLPGKRKVALPERGSDPLHVGSDLGHPCAVAGIALKTDAAAVGQRLELVEGGVLIDAHGHLASGLDLREGAIAGIASRSLRRAIPPRAIDAGNQYQKQQSGATHSAFPSVFQLDLGHFPLVRSLAEPAEDRFEELDAQQQGYGNESEHDGAREVTESDHGA